MSSLAFPGKALPQKWQVWRFFGKETVVPPISTESSPELPAKSEIKNQVPISLNILA